MVRSTYIRSSTLIGFAELLQEDGVEARDWLIQFGIDPAALDSPDLMIPYRQGLELLEFCAQRLKRPSFGLECIARMPDHFPNAGPLVLLSLFARNYREWIDLALKYWRYHTNAFTFQVLRDDKTGLMISRLHIDEVCLPSRQMVELIFGGLLALGRVLTDQPDGRCHVVRFQHSAPKDLSMHDLILKCPVEFNADHNEVLYDAKYLDYEVGGSLRPLKPLMARYMRYRIDRMDTFEVSNRAAAALSISTLIGTGHCDAENVAASLDTTPKTLQRRLAAEDTSFSAVLEEVRKNMAQRLLIESDIAVEHLAGLLDYASTPPFSHAFKRWTGMTPLEFRKVARTDGRT